MNFGTFSQPKLPGVPGVESFKGQLFHTSRWDYDYVSSPPPAPHITSAHLIDGFWTPLSLSLSVTSSSLWLCCWCTDGGFGARWAGWAEGQTSGADRDGRHCRAVRAAPRRRGRRALRCEL